MLCRVNTCTLTRRSGSRSKKLQKVDVFDYDTFATAAVTELTKAEGLTWTENVNQIVRSLKTPIDKVYTRVSALVKKKKDKEEARVQLKISRPAVKRPKAEASSDESSDSSAMSTSSADSFIEGGCETLKAGLDVIDERKDNNDGYFTDEDREQLIEVIRGFFGNGEYFELADRKPVLAALVAAFPDLKDQLIQCLLHVPK
ncbi:uncharacterized protein LOC135842008 [Planococcus citri]|uniref:uncharacterized protein LOC135842008 n=1 Tax=Planococcus citri TaxID=170843 RepID=UPI0031FA4065